MKIKDVRKANLRAWVKKHGVPQKEKSYFSQLLGEEGDVPFGERAARRLEADYQMGDHYLDTPLNGGNVIAISDIMKQNNKEVVEITQYKGIGGSMGSGVILQDQPPGEIQAWTVTPEWVQKNIKTHTGIANLCIVTGFGDSMKPLYNPGDPLIVDTGVKTVDWDGVYFFRVGKRGFIKRLQSIPGVGLRVISKNPDYETWTITEDMDFEIFGQVLKIWCGTDF